SFNLHKVKEKNVIEMQNAEEPKQDKAVGLVFEKKIFNMLQNLGNRMQKLRHEIIRATEAAWHDTSKDCSLLTVKTASISTSNSSSSGHRCTILAQMLSTQGAVTCEPLHHVVL
ncbi:hypothetical protein V5799_008134, partial [Amblyomma americanum]